MRQGSWTCVGLGGLALVMAAFASSLAGAGEVARGKVTDAEGRGTSAWLLLVSVEDGHLVARHETAADGTFEIELPSVPVEIAPHRRERGASWEFSPVASRAVAGVELEFTGYVERHKGLRGRLVDATTGRPLADRMVTVHHVCEADDHDPAARFRQSMTGVFRTDAKGRFNTTCLLGCEATMSFRGDEGHDSVFLALGSGDCARRHVLAAESR